MVDQDFSVSPHMSELPDEDITPRFYQPGEIIEGEVVRVDDDGVVVSVGLKSEGIVPPPEMRLLAQEEKELLQPGDRLQVTLVGGQGPGEMVILSYDQAQQQRLWTELSQHLAEGTAVTVRITDHNRGGVEVDYQGIRGFVPFSHLAPSQTNQVGQMDPAARVGEEATFHVLELDQAQEKLVLSERAIWQQRKDEARERLIADLEEGALVSGRVTSLRGFGAFVSLGDVDGLIPMSELSWTTVKSADEVLSVGDQVQVQVLRVDRQNQKISLSLKRTQPSPWETVAERYSENQIVEGTVTRIADFGAFVKLEDWVEGLIHISELSTRRVTNPKECVYLGQKVRVMILGIDTEKHRISLSYKKAYGM